MKAFVKALLELLTRGGLHHGRNAELVPRHEHRSERGLHRRIPISQTYLFEHAFQQTTRCAHRPHLAQQLFHTSTSSTVSRKSARPLCTSDLVVPTGWSRTSAASA